MNLKSSLNSDPFAEIQILSGVSKLVYIRFPTKNNINNITLVAIGGFLRRNSLFLSASALDRRFTKSLKKSL